MKKISIIIPIYNGERFIKECLNSVLRQDITEKEIICVDDGSTDRSVEIIKGIQEKNPDIKLIQQENMGAAAARNNALNVAQGQYVAFMDADDTYLDATGLRKMVDACEKYELPICASLRSVIRDDVISKRNVYRDMFREDSVEEIILDYKDVQCDYDYQSYIFNKNFLEKHQLRFPNLRRYQDPPFFAQAMWYASKFIVLPIELYCYRSRTEVFHFNPLQMNHMLEGIKMNVDFACQNDLEILLLNNVNRLNVDFYYRIKDSLAEGNLNAICLLLEIQSLIKKKMFDKSLDIKVLEDVTMALKDSMILHDTHQFPYGEIEYGSNIAIYGAGNVGKYIYYILKQTQYGRVVKWVDRNYKQLEKLGLKVENPESLKNCEVDCVIIAVEKQSLFDEIKDVIVSNSWCNKATIVGPIK